MESFLRLGLAAIITDRFYRTPFHGLDTLLHLFIILWLFMHIGITLVVFTREIIRSSFSAQVTVNALAVYIELAFCVFGIDVFDVSHSKKLGW